jgi:hypothetical protein
MHNLSAWATLAVTVGLLIVTAIQARIYRNQAKIMRSQLNAAAAAARASRRSADVAHRTLALTQRPCIRVRHVSLDRIYDERTPQFKVDEFVYGRFEIVNVGGSVAHVVTWRCHLMIGKEGSPPEWPTHVDPDPESDQFESDRPAVLNPGVYAELRFKSRHTLRATVEMDLSSLSHGTTLYAIGRITYADESGITRTTGFCRYWAMPEGTQIPRFHRFDDPDFEYED